jgi:2-hydroxy-6-oxonona-2,4-dienedioate hydrolase
MESPDLTNTTFKSGSHLPAEDGRGGDLHQLIASLEQSSRSGEVGGLRFRAWGSGKPLVLLHGGVGSWTHWVLNIGNLAQHFHVMVPDLPGFGDSPNVPEGATPDDYIDWVARAVKEMATPAAIELAGFSFGGTVAAAVAGRLDGGVRRLSLIGPGGFGVPVDRQLPVQPRPDKDSHPRVLRKVRAANLGVWMLSAEPDLDDPVIDLHMANLDRARFDSRAIGWRPTLLPDLASAACPVQIFWGDADRLAHPSIEARRLQCRKSLPWMRDAIIPDCAHWAMYEQAPQVNRLLLDFHLH